VTGLIPTSAMVQFWWIAPTTGSGVVALSQIAAGTIPGQEITLFGPASGAAAWFSIADGVGTDQDGPVTLDFEQSITYVWNGANWFGTGTRM